MKNWPNGMQHNGKNRTSEKVTECKKSLARSKQDHTGLALHFRLVIHQRMDSLGGCSLGTW